MTPQNLCHLLLFFSFFEQHHSFSKGNALKLICAISSYQMARILPAGVSDDLFNFLSQNLHVSQLVQSYHE